MVGFISTWFRPNPTSWDRVMTEKLKTTLFLLPVQEVKLIDLNHKLKVNVYACNFVFHSYFPPWSLKSIILDLKF